MPGRRQRRREQQAGSQADSPLWRRLIYAAAEDGAGVGIIAPLVVVVVVLVHLVVLALVWSRAAAAEREGERERKVEQTDAGGEMIIEDEWKSRRTREAR